jgi:Amt family ammonium transporter
MTQILTQTRFGQRLIPALLLALPVAAHAQATTLNTGDTAWLITATALVLFMTLPGLGAFYGGLVRTKNVLSVLMQCVAITSVATLVWIACGYSLAFADGGSAQAVIGGLDKAFLAGVARDSLTGSIPETVFAMFQMMFAVITPALVIGGFAERIRFSAVLGFTVLWLLLVYVPVTHWVWGGGWLAKLGVMDFAGGIVVHVNAGMAALVAALVIGRRRGFPQVAMAPHSLPLTVLGAGMLWVGWFGFNAGSALAANGSAGMAMLVTHVGAAAGSLAWMVMEWWRYEKPSMLGIVTGMVAGLGTITPASGYVSPLGAVIIGGVAGVICFMATQVLKRKLAIDDSLDVSPVHGVGGVVGSLLTGVFASTALGGAGTTNGSVLSQLGAQTVGIVATMVWCGLVTWLILKLLDVTVGLRVSSEEESEGLDLAAHGERAYSE